MKRGCRSRFFQAFSLTICITSTKTLAKWPLIVASALPGGKVFVNGGGGIEGRVFGLEVDRNQRCTSQRQPRPVNPSAPEPVGPLLPAVPAAFFSPSTSSLYTSFIRAFLFSVAAFSKSSSQGNPHSDLVNKPILCFHASPLRSAVGSLPEERCLLPR